MPQSLKSLRHERRVSQKRLAKELDVSESLISKWEHGVAVPPQDKIEKMSSFFDIC